MVIAVASGAAVVGWWRQGHPLTGPAFLEAVNNLLKFRHLDDGVCVQYDAAVPAAVHAVVGAVELLQPVGRCASHCILVVFLVPFYLNGEVHITAAAAKRRNCGSVADKIDRTAEVLSEHDICYRDRDTQGVKDGDLVHISFCNIVYLLHSYVE
jgi:hypothetical protein